jgi:tRNA threonylcarbamoyladenosine modification (KEOPS) complex  Pcc1 subunit
MFPSMPPQPKPCSRIVAALSEGKSKVRKPPRHQSVIEKKNQERVVMLFVMASQWVGLRATHCSVMRTLQCVHHITKSGAHNSTELHTRKDEFENFLPKWVCK